MTSVGEIVGAMNNSRQHTDKEWNAVYPHIVRLYLGEQRILEEVMQIMETRFGFKATYEYSHPFHSPLYPLETAQGVNETNKRENRISQSMYKKRIGRWQLHKYRRRKCLNSKQAGSRLQGDHTTRRHNVAPIIPRTSAVTLPTHLPDIEIDQAAKILLSNMRQLTFMHKGPDRGAAEFVGLAPSGILAVTQLYVTFSLGSTLFVKGQGKLAGKAVRKAFLMLEDIIKNAHFGLDWLLLDLLYDFVTRGQEALYATLVAHLANVADILLPRSHPVNLIANQLLRYGRDGGGDVGTLLQRAYFSKVDAVQSDPEVRATLAAQNRRVREVLIPDDPPEDLDQEIGLIIRGIKATHYELESQKGWVRTKKKKAKKPQPKRPPSPLPSSPSSPSPPPAFPIPTFATLVKNDNVLLPEFIEERRMRSLKRMEQPDPLTLGVADRLYFSEYSPELGEIYKLKARTYAHQRYGEWAAAVRLQKEMLAVMREKTAMDFWGIIRELWALEKLLQKMGAKLYETEAIRAEADERARALLADIPDDAP
ncbi:hypothetical protein GQX73_g756 [Xylaria multiplex]|uniref:Clr5 domain-containing protein n=1 Tax=Xylaria multiplex TaxID=323545 RepID=A0A7C8MW11_9PEZI|nr:hypothetical protein GQX73_g756 [Xylaria multiplex]